MTTAATDTTIYERNLALLQQIAPDLAQRLEAVEPAEGIEFAQASDGALTATVTQGGSVRTLASKRRPMDEAARLADTVDVTTTPAVVVAGFGLGYHVAELARRIGRTGIVIVYEPDVALLRAVLDRVDHTDWLTACRVLFLTDAGDSAAMSASISGVEGLVSMGLTLVEHPASKPRLAQHTKVFYDTLGSVLRALQTTVVTTLVQVRASVHNALMNLDHYARCPGVDDLKGLYAGRKAIVVSAGPSLQRNLHLLADPAVRNTHVIIAVQTVLKPMLARGIKPHFVVALDYHEISKRFYEGLTKEDVEGVTLIVQPIANPAILDAFPGTIRCVADQTLDRLLPQALRAEPNKGELTPGATVAHLAYYVARHLGCDPVGLIGQDLGFTDNQYYAAGAAIHDVWACELNPFRTLEMFEWERIARHKNMLIQKTDAMGRPIYTDEQMLTYLVQFERDFAADARKGLRTIDCTEGGVAKQSAPPLQLVQFLEQTQKSNEPISVPTPTLAQPSRKALLEHVQKVRRDVWNVGEISRQTRDLLVQMGEHHSDQQRVNTLIDRVHSLRDTVTALEPAYSLVHFLNQSGSYNRIRSDRTIDLSTMSELDRQKKRIERDIENVASLARAADDLGTLLDNTVAVLDGQPKLTRPPPLPPSPPTSSSSSHTQDNTGSIPSACLAKTGSAGLVVWAVGTDRIASLGRTLNQLNNTILRIKQRAPIVVVADDEQAVRAQIESMGANFARTCAIFVQTNDEITRKRATLVRSARAFSPNSWRGGIGGATCFDEAFEPTAASAIMHEHGLDAAVFVDARATRVGEGWGGPDALVDRWREDPTKHRLVFSQAPPRRAACVLSRDFVDQLATAASRDARASMIGSVLGYQPATPQGDLIATQLCVAVDPAVRDAVDGGVVPTHARIELTTKRAIGGVFASGCDAVELPADAAIRAIDEAARRGLAVSFEGRGDPLLHDEAQRVIEHAVNNTDAVMHVRSDLLCDEHTASWLARCGADVISANLIADDAGAYERLTGVDGFATSRAQFEMIAEAREANTTGTGWDGGGWTVARLTRCDATYGHVERFYDQWVGRLGCAVIDPQPGPVDGERIEPIAPPTLAARRMASECVVIGAQTADVEAAFAAAGGGRG